MVTHPKFYYFDVGVYRHLRPFSRGDVATELDGHGLETLVFQELSAINHYFHMQYEISFWRTVDHVEVDFILYGPLGFLAIEVKLSSTIHPKDIQGLLTFKEEFPDAKLLLFYGGERRLYVDGIEVIPVRDALSTLPELLGCDRLTPDGSRTAI
jgi:predicted AAA+ superfamily ATPase